ncbi:MAG: hypothetical protein Q8Q56_00685, partial [Alphaproteobacteria bacterium]|nr:hypothetical protein [Alphaproteobacteria bacterium]
YRRAFGFNSLRLIMTIDALELRDNGHISFGKWETNFDGHWKDQDINAVIQEVEDDEVIAGRVRCSPGERSTVPNYLPNYALKNGPWIVHRFVEGALTGSFNTGYQTVGECPYYAAPAAAAAPAGAGGGH